MIRLLVCRRCVGGGGGGSGGSGGGDGGGGVCGIRNSYHVLQIFTFCLYV